MTFLEKLEYKLNKFESKTGATFDAVRSEDNETLQVTCSINPDALIVIVASDEQILTVTHLFTTDDVAEAQKSELYECLLKLSPLVPLSSLGLKDESDCILYGSMPLKTKFKNIAHELECQADNYTEVFVALKDFFIEPEQTEEI